MCNNIEELKRQQREILDQRKRSKDQEERSRLLKEYSKLYMRIKYYSDEEYKAEKLRKNKEHHETLKDNEYYQEMRNKYFKEYYQKHKNNNISIVC